MSRNTNRVKIDQAFKEGYDPDVSAETLAENWMASLAEALNPEKSSGEFYWEPQAGPQTMAFYSTADETFYGGAAGGGKFLKYFTNVLTPFGWKLSQDIKVGDVLVASDGTQTKVIGVYPHTNKDIYEITFIDGAKVTVSDDHLWLYWYAGNAFKAKRYYALYNEEKGFHWEEVHGKLGTTKSLFEYHQKQVEAQNQGKRPYWIIMPLCNPVEFTRPTRTRQGDVIRIDPYLLGLLIGDGSITDNIISITTIDQFIVDRVQEIYGENAVFDGKKCVRFNQNAKLKQELKSYDLLNKYSDTKFIPEQYLFSSILTRTELCKGLLDSEGYVDDRGHVSYTTVSKQLALDVQHLFRSLGCKATITEKESGYTNKNTGEFIECKLSYNIWIQGENLERFVGLPRKKERCKEFNGGVSEPGRRVVDIQYIGKGDGVCFAIDHPTGLHVVQDFIVTHNTDLLIGLAISPLSRHKKSIIFRREYPQLKDVVARCAALLPETAKYNGNSMVFNNIPGGKTLEFGSVPFFEATNKYKGRPHDLKAFDEVSDFCWAEGTEALTLSGWKKLQDIQIGESVLSLNEDNVAEYKEVKDVVEFYRNGKMLQAKSTRIEYLVTPNHTFPILPQKKMYWKLVEARNLPENIYHPFSFEYLGAELDYFNIKKVNGRGIGTNSNQTEKIKADDMLEFMGWYLSEGSTYERGKRNGPITRIQQIKPNKKLEEMIFRLPFNFKKLNIGIDKHGKDRGVLYYVCSRQLHNYLEQFGKTEDKFIPDWIFNVSRRQLQIFFDAFVEGDGHRCNRKGIPTGGINIGLKSEKLIDGLQIIATLLGLRSKKSQVLNKKYNKYYHYLYVYSSEIKKISLRKTKHIKEVDYTGIVRCITVEDNHTFLARYKGNVIWSGNSEASFTFLSGWARSVDPTVPIRVVAAGNPPTNSDGEWVIKRWRAWLDPQHENPAVPGELRYFATIDNEDKEMEDGSPFEYKGDTIKPKSRTFIPARLEDNAYLRDTDYKSILQNMPEPYRSQLLYGDFGLTIRDDPWQVCSTTITRDGKERWQLLRANGELEKIANSNVTYGLDVAEAGKDMTVLVKLSGHVIQWVKYLKEPDLMKQADWVIHNMSGSKDAYIGVDAIGVGSGLASRLRQLGLKSVPIKVSTSSNRRSKEGNMKFTNLRSDLWWYLRERLEASENPLCLYPDQKLIQEIQAPRYRILGVDTIQVDDTESIKDRIGRSPDAASALLMALYVTKERHVGLRIA